MSHFYIAISTSRTGRASEKPFWEGLGDVDIGPYWALSLTNFDRMTTYFDAADDLPGLGICLDNTRNGQMMYFALVEADTVIPFAVVPVIVSGNGYVPVYADIRANAPMPDIEFWPAVEYLAKTMSERDFGHSNESAIAQALDEHQTAEAVRYQKLFGDMDAIGAS